MIMLNYQSNPNSKIVSKEFETTLAAYEFAIKNIATDEDREYYEELCGKTFESVERKDELMMSIMSNAIENICLIYKEN